MYYKIPKNTRKINTELAAAHKSAALECLKALDTTYASDVYNNLIAGRHELIQKPDPNQYSLPFEFFKDSQAYAIIGKNELFCNEEILLPELIEGFFAQEQLNHSTNLKFSKLRFDPLLDQVRNNVLKIIGKAPPVSKLYGEYHLVDEIRFGPGSSYFAHGSLVNPMDKIRNGKVSLTTGCEPLWTSYTGKTPFANKEVLRVESDFFDFVPKNFKSLRTISIGNDGNTLVQLSLGKALRHRLSRFYDLNKQQLLHKSVVEKASICRSHATVDISNASNSVCKQVVKALLPPIWYDLLNKARHHKTQIGNYVHDLELFSSMGNGFTFELETIIFLAIAMTLPNHKILTSNDGDISVYGDDIICRDEDYDLLVSRLEHFGFKVNSSKSFSGQSWFRESCGADFFAGVDVTPIYLRGRVDVCNLQTLYVLPNKIRQISLAIFGDIPQNTRFARAYAIAIRCIPKQYRITGIDLSSEELNHVETPHGWLHTTFSRDKHKQVIYQRCFVPTPVRKKLYRSDGSQNFTDDDILTYALHGNPSSGSVLRRRVKGGTFKVVVCYG